MSVTRVLAVLMASQVLPAAAFAQDQEVPAAPVEEPAAAPAAVGDQSAGAAPTATPLSGFARFQQENVIGKELRSLKKDGVDLSLDVVGNIAGNPIGGNRKGFAESHWVSAAANVDLEKVLGWSDTRLHVQGAWFSGDSLGRDYIGNSISFQQTWRPVPGPRLTQFNIEHDFGRLNLMVGRAAVNSYFNNSPLNCVFMSNTACLTAYGGISDIGITAFPNSSWAAKAQYSLSKRAYVQLGVFDYNNDLNLKGKGGVDLSLGKGTGALIAGEVGYESDPATSRLPGLYKLGFYLNTDGGQSPYYDIHGASAAQSGLARAALGGNRLGIYAMVDQTIARAPGKSKRSLAAFGRLFVNAGNTQQLDWFASAGLVKTGTFKGRDDDTIGFIVSDTHFSAQQIAYLRDLRAKAGGTGSPGSNEIIAELNYGFAALPGLRIMPNVQYAINPDPIYATSRKTDIPNAVVLGVRVDLKLAQFFGK
ncbi:OprB family porin [Novosphingobium sp. PhB165]|uniref:carbohydrate porin n=1 Tax=Novosphingobium sp. PhB165 TaxID=2485105 RepID=UPI001044F347|nr:carbohydrate porin [Novosphingobium sp. PhB165]TCM16460.1 OprB family porin [Novosphingobium sp. PhB165]